MTANVVLRPLVAEDVDFVVRNLREKDREEIFATQFNDDPRNIVAACMGCPQFAWTACLDEPIAVVGAMPMHPGVWSVFAFATDRFEEVAYPLTKFVKRAIIPALASSGCRRAQCLSLASHADAHRWLTYLGAEAEAVLRGFGRAGEDFVMFAWRNTKPDVLLTQHS